MFSLRKNIYMWLEIRESNYQSKKERKKKNKLNKLKSYVSLF